MNYQNSSAYSSRFMHRATTHLKIGMNKKKNKKTTHFLPISLVLLVFVPHTRCSSGTPYHDRNYTSFQCGQSF
jgi:hypothetical protein